MYSYVGPYAVQVCLHVSVPVWKPEDKPGGLFLRSHTVRSSGALQLEEVSCSASPRESTSLYLPSTGITNAGHISRVLCHPWESHSGPPALMASTLPLNRLSLGPPVFVFVLFLW